MCHKDLIHTSKCLAKCYATYLARELAYLKHGNTKDVHFQGIVANDHVHS